MELDRFEKANKIHLELCRVQKSKNEFEWFDSPNNKIHHIEVVGENYDIDDGYQHGISVPSRLYQSIVEFIKIQLELEEQELKKQFERV